MKQWPWLAGTLILVSGLALLAGCGGSGNPRGGATGTVNLHISDPPTCSGATGGIFDHVFVTVRQVQVHTSATAGDNDPGWTTLISLDNAPKQVDLLGLASSQCFLADLGSASLNPGTYQQIRVILADNSASVSGNQCGTAGANCVVVAGSANPQPIQIGSAAQTGLKIPSGQIAGGQFTIAAGQTKDLNIDFDACASLVVQGNGQFRLKPVLHAGEVSLTSSSISGKVVDASGHPIPNLKAVVALEQRNGTNVSVIMQTLANSDGTFSLCPVPAGTYDVVVSAIDTTNNIAFGPTVTLNVQPGTALGNVAVGIANAGTTGGSTAPATITGLVATQNPSLQPISGDVTVAALQTFAIQGAPASFIIPSLQPAGATVAVNTAVCSSPGGFACANYTLALPASNASVGVFSATGTNYSPGTPGAVNYTVTATPALSCSTASQTVTVSAALPGNHLSAAPLLFVSCQ